MNAEQIAAGLTKAQREALTTLPLPRAGKPHLMQSERGYGDIWRKSSKHFFTLLDLVERGIVETRESRGEALWRLTRPLGLEVRAIIMKEQTDAQCDYSS